MSLLPEQSDTTPRSPGLPPTVSDAEFVAVVDKVAGVLFKKFGKVHGDIDDFRQQVALWALAALPKYDPARGTLAALVHRHARFRAMNALRDQVMRDDPPCKMCHAGAPCDKAGDQPHCSHYAKWLQRNRSKMNIARPLSLSFEPGLVEGRASPDPSAEQTAATTDLARLIDQELPIELRADYLMMRDGVSVPLPRRQRVQRAVAEIITAAGVEAPECEAGRRKSAARRHDEGDSEQESGGDARPTPLCAESVFSNTIPKSVDDQPVLSSAA